MVLTQWANLHTNEVREIVLAATALQVGAGATTIFAMDIDNSDNAFAVYVKIWDHAGPTTGTHGCNECHKIPASSRMEIPMNGTDGVEFSANACWIACVKENDSSGTTPPGAAVIARLWTD